MQKQRLLWLLFPSFLVITLISLLAISLYAVNSVQTFYMDDLSTELVVRGSFFESRMAEFITAKDYKGADDLAKSLGRKSATRITVILPDGRVVADSDHDPATMDRHDDRPEVKNVLQGHFEQKTGYIRHSYTLNEDMMYVAMPLASGDKGDNLVGVLRLSMPVGRITGTLETIYHRIAVGGIIIAILAAAISLGISRRITQPLEEMKKGADHFARGELGWRLEVPNTREMGTLAEAMNKMAEELDHRIRTLMQQRNEQQAVLSSMVEGVLAVDMDERIISMNEAGAKLLAVSPETIHGRSIQEVVRNTELQEFVSRALASPQPVEGDITIREGSIDRFLQAHGTILHDARDRGMGAVIVLNDVTRLRKLETVRKDFVANVSHELKTPITSIKGFVETLLEGAMKDPEDAERFLQIIARQTDRLNAIIEDILILSRIEDQTEKDKIDFTECKIFDVLQSAVQVCELQARAKHTTVDIDCGKDLTVRMNAPLMEQAIVNLVDNAIKYSGEGKNVFVQASRIDDEIQILVSDKGCGIESQYLGRIFERFYRVDKARSRKLGGTGLGLAIVKHIVLVHGGSIDVRSISGQGTTFTIHLPAKQSS
jgi:two-component system phosphate regulon sensor histidine kinase PhoR